MCITTQDPKSSLTTGPNINRPRAQSSRPQGDKRPNLSKAGTPPSNIQGTFSPARGQAPWTHPDRATTQTPRTPTKSHPKTPEHKPPHNQTINSAPSRPNSLLNQTATTCGDPERPSRIQRARYHQAQAYRPRSQSTPTEDEFLNIRPGTYNHLLYPQTLPQVSQYHTLTPDTASIINRASNSRRRQHGTTTTDHNPRHGTTPGRNE